MEQELIVRFFSNTPTAIVCSYECYDLALQLAAEPNTELSGLKVIADAWCGGNLAFAVDEASYKRGGLDV